MTKEFERYMHIEPLNTTDTDGLLNGTCYIFDKLDGMNAQVWLDYIDAKGTEIPVIRCGTRNKELNYENRKNGRGFFEFVINNPQLKLFLLEYPHYRLYGEWLIQGFKTQYKDLAYDQFYVFDILYEDTITTGWVDYKVYAPLLRRFSLDYIPLIKEVQNPTSFSIKRAYQDANFLVPNKKNPGEGIVIKNYQFVNQYGRTVWGKYKGEETAKSTKDTESTKTVNFSTVPVEEYIVSKYLTAEFIQKEKIKLAVANQGWQRTLIGQLLKTIIHEFLKELLPIAIEDFKGKLLIDFDLLNKIIVRRTKNLCPELFT